MSRSHHRHRRLRTTAAGTALAALALASVASGPTAVAAPDPAGKTAPDSASKAAKPTWRDAGRLIGPGHDWPMIASSSSNVLAAVATSGGIASDPKPTLVVRRLPNGTVSTYKKVLGLTTGVGVDRDGDILVVGQRGDSLLATSWPRKAKRPTTTKVVPAASVPGLISAELLTNPRGDAAIVAHYRNGATLVARRFGDAKKWRAPVKVLPARYGGTLDDLSLAPDGHLVGAFLADHNVDLRVLERGSRTFYHQQPMIHWPEIDDVPGAFEEYASVTVGPRGDLVVALSYSVQHGDSDVANNVRYVFFNEHRRRFTGEVIDSDYINFDDPVIGADGSVTVREGLTMSRWSPHTRTFRSQQGAWFKANNPRGDLLVGSAAYRGRLHIWPVDKKPQPSTKSPRGLSRAWALTNNYRTYVVTQGEGRRPSWYLHVGTLDHR